MTRKTITLAAAALFTSLVASSSQAIMLSMVDDFQDGTQQGWGGSSQQINIPTDGGPDGSGDRYMQYASQGGGGNNSRMIIPNEQFGTQWAGDYTAAGAIGIELDAANFGNTDLNLRMAITDGSSWYASTNPVTVPAGSDWTSVAFMLVEDSMSQLNGASSFASLISNVTGIRLLSSENLPTISFGGTGSAQGDLMVADIGVDNVRPIGVPEPATLAMALATLVAGAVLRRG